MVQPLPQFVVQKGVALVTGVDLRMWGKESSCEFSDLSVRGSSARGRGLGVTSGCNPNPT